tara:strand:- start:494 stop:1306 length:813 start_codon:yes stop_codon:yes gene_type:complete
MDQLKTQLKTEIKTKNTLGGLHYTYIIVLGGVLLLFFVMIYYERYYLPKKQMTETQNFNKDPEVLLDKKNNNNKPYHFIQKFGTTKDFNQAYDENDEAVSHMDTLFKTLSNQGGCQDNNMKTASLFMRIKFPHVLPNKDWKTSYKLDKPIVAFGESPIISYNPYYNYFNISVLLKYASLDKEFRKHVRIDDIPNTTFIDIIIVFDNKKLKIYFNKNLELYETLENIPILHFTENHKIKYGEYNNNFNGFIDKMTFYKKALITSEIESMNF